ncbi:hypothetical protein FOA52_004877 [Chlamydomonas sp. UWO 241]|nr:hypothetical protein FOA52_004877 [Chlamydomonas sp. UWO 241]
MRVSGGRQRRSVQVNAVAEVAPAAKIIIDNITDSKFTVIEIEGPKVPGLLQSISATLRDLGLEVKAVVEGEGATYHDTFFVQKTSGGKITDEEEVKTALEVLLRAKTAMRLIGNSRPQFSSAGGRGGADSTARMSTLMDTYMKNDVLSIQEGIVNHVEYTMARSRYKFDEFEAYQATSLSLRDRLIERWNDTQTFIKEKDPKRVYYLSMEFLMGRSLLNTLYNLDVHTPYTEALAELGYNLEAIAEKERDAALGNGGLGRLASCFLDSMATLNLPAWGYGIRYSYGMFRQSIINGFQHEQPDYWLNFGNPWEIERLIVQYPIKFYGHVSVANENGKQVFKWNAGEVVTAVAYDNPIPGFGTRNCINLRLWAAKPAKEFDLEAFNTGDYVTAILSKQRAETLSSVLYPDDRTYEGKELRLKQQHFFVSATIQDVVRRYVEGHPGDWNHFADKVAFQLNDTHPTIAVAELMRQLMDDHKLGWTKSMQICNSAGVAEGSGVALTRNWIDEAISNTCVRTRVGGGGSAPGRPSHGDALCAPSAASVVFAFTNHTVLPEALEKWPISLMEKLLPRHMQIIYDINYRFLTQVCGWVWSD